MSGPKIFNSSGFAKEILWRLARQQADLIANKLLLIEIISHLKGKPAKEILNEHKGACEKKAQELYLESLQAAEVPPDSKGIQD